VDYSLWNQSNTLSIQNSIPNSNYLRRDDQRSTSYIQSDNNSVHHYRRRLSNKCIEDDDDNKCIGDDAA
jgi:hypothetical protein